MGTTVSTPSFYGNNVVGGYSNNNYYYDEKEDEQLWKMYLTRDLSHSICEARLLPGSGRIMRTYRMRHAKSGAVYVTKAFVTTTKAIISHDEKTSSSLLDISEKLKGVSHVLPYIGWFTTHNSTLTTINTNTNTNNGNNTNNSYHHKSSSSSITSTTTTSTTITGNIITGNNTAGTSTSSSSSSGEKMMPVYLIRPHVYTTLADRMAMRPFLTHAEKLFFTYQLLVAVSNLHQNGVCHGHLTLENVGWTSWNYLVLLDIFPNNSSSGVGRPIILQESQDYIHHYYNNNSSSSSGNTEGKCYLAPERFAFSSTPSSSTTENSTTNDNHQSSSNTNSTNTTSNNSNHTSKLSSSNNENTKYTNNNNNNDNSSRSNNQNYEKKKDSSSLLTVEMDMFSLGCCLLELHLDSGGVAAMDLGELMQYKVSGKLPPTIQQRLAKLKSSKIRAAVRRMLSLDPKRRLNASDYLHRIFPPNYNQTIYTKIILPLSRQTTTTPTSIHNMNYNNNNNLLSCDARMALLADHYNSILQETLSIDDPTGQSYIQTILLGQQQQTDTDNTEKEDNNNTNDREGKMIHANCFSPFGFCNPFQPPPSSSSEKQESHLNSSLTTMDVLISETEALLHEIEMSHLDNSDSKNNNNHINPTPMDSNTCDSNINNSINSEPSPTEEAVVGTPEEESKEQYHDFHHRTGALLIYIQAILATIRHALRPSSKLVGLHLLRMLSFHIYQSNNNNNDNKYRQNQPTTKRNHHHRHNNIQQKEEQLQQEIRLERMVPTIMTILQHDSDALVRATALRVLTDILTKVQDFPPSNAALFEKYILPRLTNIFQTEKTTVVLRIAMAECLADLAETALRFLDMSHAIQLHEFMDNTLHKKNTSNKTKTTTHHNDKKNDSTSQQQQSILPTKDNYFDDNVADLLGEKEKLPETSSKNKTTTNTQSQIDINHHNNISMLKKKPNMTDSPGTKKLIPNIYDKELAALHDIILRWVIDICSTPPNASTAGSTQHVKLALLQSLPQLCQFFGKDKVITTILPQILSMFNDKLDWQLRVGLLKHLPAVCAAVGRAATEQFVIPCIEMSLLSLSNERDEMVVTRALHCISELISMGLLTRYLLLSSGGGEFKHHNNNSVKTIGILAKYTPLLLYPLSSVRFACCCVITNCIRRLGVPDDSVFVKPIIRPYLRYELEGDQWSIPQEIVGALILPLSKSQWRIELDQLRRYDRTLRMENTEALEANKHSSWVEGKSIVEKHLENYSMKTSTVQGKHAMERTYDYLQMLNKNTRPSTLTNLDDSSNNNTIDESISNIAALEDITGPLRGAFTFYIPNQKYAENLTSPLPDWYQTMCSVHNNFKEGGDEDKKIWLSSPKSSLRSISSVNKVYGLIGNTQRNTHRSPSTSQKTQRKFLPAAYSINLNLQETALLDNDLDDSALSVSAAASLPLEPDGTISKDHAIGYLGSAQAKILDIATSQGEWSSLVRLDPALSDTANQVSKLRALSVPPIPPRLGILRDKAGKSLLHSNATLHGSSTQDSSNNTLEGARRNEWKPKVDALVACSSPAGGHSGPVTRLAVSQDQSFFVSASHDGTSRVWELRQTEESAGDLQSCLTYTEHKDRRHANTFHSRNHVRINDVTVLENSHSVATAGSEGSVHVWRVDMVSSKQSSSLAGANSAFTTNDNQSTSSTQSPHIHEASRVSGSTVLRRVHPQEGEILTVSHFNTPSASVVTFGTQGGVIHSWDLRSELEPFALRIQPELGHLTSMAVGNDRHWMVAGTSRGFLTLWDIRFGEKMVKIWQHSSLSPISRLGTAFTTLPQDGKEARPYVLVAAGLNETCLFDVSRSLCRQCFRVLDPSLSYVDQISLPPSCLSMPVLHDIPIPSDSRRKMYGIYDAVNRMINDRFTPPEPNIQSISGRIGATGSNYIMTGGTDGYIRYWDLANASKCYTVSGLVTTQPRPIYDSVDFVGATGSAVSPSKLFLCRQMPMPKLDEMESCKVPQKLHRGLVRPENHHKDAVLDLKKIDSPIKGLLSCSRDGVIKLWR